MRITIAVALLIMATMDAFAQRAIDSRELMRPVDVQTKRPAAGSTPTPTQDQVGPATTAPLSIGGTVGAYCETAVDILHDHKLKQVPGAPSVSIIYDNCSPGDVLTILTAFTGLIAQVCDNTLPATVLPGPGGIMGPSTLLCTIAPQRTTKTKRGGVSTTLPTTLPSVR